MKNTLALKTERLAELTTDDLQRVHGAAQTVLECVATTKIPTVRGCTTNIYCP